MITRFNKITQTGVFRNTLNLDQFQFKKFTVFYALNTHGKTTLKAIFSSIAQDDPSVLEKRRSIPHEALLQDVSLAFLKNGREHYLHFSDAWNPNHLKGKILIFDNDFIHRNVLTGFTITRENKESFTDFILGEEGVALSEEIKLLNKNLKEKKDAVLKPDYIKNFKSQKDIDAFLNLQIQESESELQKTGIEWVTQLDNLSNLADIAKLPAIHPIQTTIEEQLKKVVEQLNPVLSKDYKEVTQAVKEKLLAHFNQCTQGEGAKSWIKQGLKTFKKNDCCPFCGQHLTHVHDLIDAYNNFFNEHYEDFSKTISTQLHTLERDLDAITLSIKTELLTLVNHLNKYKQYDPTIQSEFNDDNIMLLENEVKEKLNLQKEEIKKIISAKNKEPHQSMHPILLNMDLLSAIYNLNFALNDHSQMKSAIEKAIKLKNDNAFLSTEQVNTKRIELSGKIQILEKKISRIKQDKECSMYRSDMQNIAQLTAVVTEKTSQLKIQQSDYIKQYFDEMNQHFIALGSCDFTLSCEASPYGQKKVYELKIAYKGKKLSADDITTMLSESDKRGLAFAIFVTKLSQVKNTSELIIVLDDPTVSFDDQRISATVEVMKKMQLNSSQMILLTHSSSLINTIIRSNLECAYYEIIKNSETSTMAELKMQSQSLSN